MRRVVLSLAVALVVAGAISFMFVGPTRTQAAGDDTGVFIIPQSDGYGMSTCLVDGSDCGRIVAQAWCEARGFQRVASYGVASPTDITGSTGSARQAQASEPPVLITCER